MMREFSSIHRFGLWLGPIVAASVLFIGPPESLVDSSQWMPAAWIVFALLLLMAIWWVTEAVPIPVTSLLPIIILPLFGVRTIQQVSAPYMHPVVILLMGGFIFAKAIEAWGLHERIALQVVKRASRSPTSIIGGFMCAAAGLSMWISNTATAIMMMPIALSVATLIDRDAKNTRQFTYALLLSIAFACSIGGLGTPIGTPTNLIVIGYLNDQYVSDIGFGQWMSFGLPAVVLLLPCAWFVLTRWAFQIDADKPQATRKVRDLVSQRLANMGTISTAEKRTLGVFIIIASLWVLRRPLSEVSFMYGAFRFQPLGGLTDHMIAIVAVLLCFLIPSGNPQTDKKSRSTLLSWPAAEQIPWGVLLLFGGGLSLAQAISSTGLSAYFGTTLAGFATLPTVILILILAFLVLALTELTSNVATASALMPVLGALALETGVPLELMAAPLALAASCAFMLPMATGPNAVVFATNELALSTMAKAGFRLNLLALVVITLIAYWVAPLTLTP